jgi:hypothetical protein
MNEIEKLLVKCLADIAKSAMEIGKTQVSMANFICQHLPNLTEDEKQQMLTVAETSWLQQQQLQDSAEKLGKIV